MALFPRRVPGDGMRKVVYTALTDGYKLRPVVNGKRGWDFVCFSESPLRCRGWTINVIDRDDILIEEFGQD